MIQKQVLVVARNKSLEYGYMQCQAALSRKIHTSYAAAQNSRPAETKEKHQPSIHSQKSINPIRQMCDAFSVNSISKKPLLSFNLGDPSNTGALPLCPGIQDAVKETLLEQKFYGYGPSHGFPEARAAVAKHFSLPEAPFTQEDVIMTSGASHALQLVIEAVANPGDNILIPTPGFPLYKTLFHSQAIQGRYYPLIMGPEETLIDLDKMESMIDHETKALIINNPSNPTGAVFPKEHLEAILRIAEKHKVTVVADEVYGDLTFNGGKFIPMATLEPKVPMITVDSLSKRYIAPGWRLGWIIVHNRGGLLDDLHQGLINLSQKIVGPSALVQGAFPKILDRTPKNYFETIKNLLAANAEIAYESLKKVPGLHPIKPRGAMYCLVEYDPKLYGKESKFMQELIYEENVFCLPGTTFFYPNVFRLVLIFPTEKTIDACERITAFCERRLAKKKF